MTAAPAYLLGMRTLKAIALIAILAACGPVNAEPRLAAYRLLVPGQSTAQDAAALFGRPMSATALSNGNALLQWMEARGGGILHLAVLFDSDGRMIRIQQVGRF